MGGSFALPPGPDEEYEPFDEKVAVMHLAGELDDLDYEDLVFD